jgi:hypothetical protein
VRVFLEVDWLAFFWLTCEIGLSLQAQTAIAQQKTDPIHLPEIIIQGNPVTTITVGTRIIQVIVDTDGGAP